MNYTRKSFSVPSPSTKQYRDNYDRTFGNISPSGEEVTCDDSEEGTCPITPPTDDERNRAIASALRTTTETNHATPPTIIKEEK